jgi:hypothetical protein
MIIVDPSGPLITTYGWILWSCAQFQHCSLNAPLVFLDRDRHLVPFAAQEFGFLVLPPVQGVLSSRAGYTTGLVECLTRPVVEREESQREENRDLVSPLRDSLKFAEACSLHPLLRGSLPGVCRPREKKHINLN